MGLEKYRQACYFGIVDPTGEFEAIETDYRAALEAAMLNVTDNHSNLEQQREVAAKTIRGPLRSWLARLFVRIPADKMPMFLNGLPKKWRTKPEELFDGEARNTALYGVSISGQDPRGDTPPALTAEEATSDVRWRNWLDDYEKATGQDLQSPYRRTKTPGWVVWGATGLAVAGLVYSLTRWRPV